jgi:uncharacterized protein (DUF433 family)
MHLSLAEILSSERQTKLAGYNVRVFIKRLVKIADLEEEDHAGVAAFDLQVLAAKRGRHKTFEFIPDRNIIAPKGDMNYQDYITIEPGKRSGKPCIRGMRITVYDVLDYLASGMSIEEILDDFPELTREDILACLAFAADQGRKVLSIPA